MDSNNTSKKDYLLPVSILIAAVLIAGSLIYSAGSKNYNKIGGANNDNQQQTDIQKTLAGDSLKIESDDIVMGQENSPITIIAYSDLSCPFCAASAGYNKEVIDYLKRGVPSWTPPEPGIIKNYVKTGKAKLVLRYFPGHGTGEEATKIMLCANEQGKFWELRDKIFENQKLVENVEKIKELAAGLGIDIGKINSCLANKKYDYKLAKDKKSGGAAGVQGTPAFFINGEKLEGAQPFSAFKEIIDKLLTSK